MLVSRILVLGVALGVLTGCSEVQRGQPASRAEAQPVLPFDQADFDKSSDLSTQEAVLVPGLQLLVVDRNRDGMISREEYEAWARGDRRALPDTAGGVETRP